MDMVAAYRAFVRIAERGSFSAVARETGQSQPTVSRHLSELEEYLGTRLIARTTRSLSLTAEGQEFLEKAREVLRSLEEAEQSVGARAQALSGRLVITAPVSLGRIVLLPRLSGFMARHQGVVVDLLLSDRPAQFGKHGADLALAAGLPRRRTDRSRKLGEVPLVLCGAPGLIRDSGTPGTVDALADLPAVVSLGSANDGGWQLERGAEIREVSPSPRFRSDSWEAVLAALVEGIGVGLAPLWLVQDAIDRGALWRLLPQWSGGVVPLYLVQPAARAPNARMRAFSDYLGQSLKGDRMFA